MYLHYILSRGGGAGINTFAVLRKRCISPCIVYTLKIDKKIRYRHLIKTLDFNTHFYTLCKTGIFFCSRLIKTFHPFLYPYGFGKMLPFINF